MKSVFFGRQMGLDAKEEEGALLSFFIAFERGALVGQDAIVRVPV